MSLVWGSGSLALERQEDAERFHQELPERLEKSGLELSAAKTRVIPFDREPPTGKSRFEFLGFEFYRGKDRKGRPHLPFLAAGQGSAGRHGSDCGPPWSVSPDGAGISGTWSCGNCSGN